MPFDFLRVLLVVLAIQNNDRMQNDAVISFQSAIFFAPALLITMYSLEKCSNSLSITNVLILLIGIVLLAFFIIRGQKTENGILSVEVIKNGKLKGLCFVNGSRTQYLLYLSSNLHGQGIFLDYKYIGQGIPSVYTCNGYR